MDEYDKMVKVQRKWMIIFLAILVIGLSVLPYKQILLGLLLGSIVSVFNIWFLQKRVKRFGEAIAGGRRSEERRVGKEGRSGVEAGHGDSRESIGGRTDGE